MRKEIVINGNDITSTINFHQEIARMLSFPGYYDNTLDSLLDCLNTYIDPKLTIHWTSHNTSKAYLGHEFDQIIEVFQMIKGYHPEFEYHLN